MWNTSFIKHITVRFIAIHIYSKQAAEWNGGNNIIWNWTPVMCRRVPTIIIGLTLRDKWSCVIMCLYQVQAAPVLEEVICAVSLSSLHELARKGAFLGSYFLYPVILGCVKSLMHARWHNSMLLQVARRCKHRHLTFRPVLLDGAPVCPHWYLSWFNPLALASCAPSHTRRKQPSCLMRAMWADSETLSARNIQASEPLSVGRGTVATGCSFYAEHCPGKKGTGRCSSLTECSRLCCWNKWHHRKNPCVDRLAHAGTHIYTFTKIKSIIDKNSKWCGGGPAVKTSVQVEFSWEIWCYTVCCIVL